MSVRLEPASAAVDARFATPMARSLPATQQRDALPDTIFDASRCGAAATVAAAVLEGAPSVNRLIQGLREARQGGVSLRGQPMRHLDAISGELERGSLSPQSIQRLQDYLYAVVAKSPDGGTNGYAGRAMLGMAGLQTRQFALSAGMPQAERAAALRREIGPNEAAPLRLVSDGDSHTVLYGRDAAGREFVYDSEDARGMLRAPSDARAIDTLLRQAVQVNGGEVVRFSAR